MIKRKREGGKRERNVFKKKHGSGKQERRKMWEEEKR